MNKTPDEIKKGLEHGISDCEAVMCCKYECPYENSCWPYAGGTNNTNVPKEMLQDALAYIHQLEAANNELLKKCERLELERDAAVTDMETIIYSGAEIVCGFCKHHKEPKCIQTCGLEYLGFEWRGVKEE